MTAVTDFLLPANYASPTTHPEEEKDIMMKKLLLALTFAALAFPALADSTAIVVTGPTTATTVSTLSGAAADASNDSLTANVAIYQ